MWHLPPCPSQLLLCSSALPPDDLYNPAHDVRHIQQAVAVRLIDQGHINDALVMKSLYTRYACCATVHAGQAPIVTAFDMIVSTSNCMIATTQKEGS